MSTIDFLQKALDLIKEAIDADNAARYKEAYDLYFKGLDYYMLAIKCELFDLFSPFTFSCWSGVF